MRKTKTYTSAKKLEVIKDLLKGDKTFTQVCIKHQIAKSTVKGWQKQFENNGHMIFEVSKPKKNDLKYFLAIGVLSFLSISMFIQAVTRLPIGFTLFIFYSGVLISGFSYGSFVLKEKIKRYELLALIISVLGLIIMYVEGTRNFDLLGMFFAFLAGSGFSLNLAVSKNISGKYSAYQISLTTFIVVFILSIPMLLATEGINISFAFGLKGWLLFFIYSLVIVLAYLLAVYSYKYIETQKASIILLAEILFAVLNGFIFYSEIPTTTILIGGSMVLLAQIIITKGGD